MAIARLRTVLCAGKVLAKQSHGIAVYGRRPYLRRWDDLRSTRLCFGAAKVRVRVAAADAHRHDARGDVDARPLRAAAGRLEAGRSGGVGRRRAGRGSPT